MSVIDLSNKINTITARDICTHQSAIYKYITECFDDSNNAITTNRVHRDFQVR